LFPNQLQLLATARSLLWGSIAQPPGCIENRIAGESYLWINAVSSLKSPGKSTMEQKNKCNPFDKVT